MKTTMNEDVRVKVAVYRPIFDKIAKAVGEQLNIDPKEIGRRDRHRGYVKARKLICYYRNEFSNCPLGVVGYMLNAGNPFDHSNVSIMIKKISSDLSLKSRTGNYIYSDLRNENQRIRMRIKIVMPNIRMEEWLENFATSSGNFMMSEAV